MKRKIPTSIAKKIAEIRLSAKKKIKAKESAQKKSDNDWDNLVEMFGG